MKMTKNFWVQELGRIEPIIIGSQDANELLEEYYVKLKNNSDTYVIAYCEMLMAAKYYYLGEYDKCKKFLESAGNHQVKNEEFQNKLNYWVAIHSYMNGQTKEPVVLGQNTLNYFIQSSNERYRMMAMEFMANLLSVIGYFDEALLLLEQCIEYYGEKQLVKKVIVNRIQLAITFVTMKKYEKAEFEFKKIMEVGEEFIQQTPPLFQCNFWHHYGNLYQEWGKLKQAEKCYNEIDKLMDKIKHPYFQCAFYNTLGSFLNQKKDFVSGIQYLEKSLGFCDLIKSSRMRVLILHNLALSYIGLKKYTKGQSYFNDAIKESKKGFFGRITAAVHEDAYHLYKQLGKFDKATYHIERSVQIKEELYSKESDVRIEAISALNELKRNQIKLIEAEKVIALKSQELELTGMYLHQKTDLLRDLEVFINELKKENVQKQRIFNALSDKLKSVRLSNVENEAFKEKLDARNQEFIAKLRSAFPLISKTEARVASLLVKQMSTKEICDLLVMDVRSVEMHRYRLRKKMGLKIGDDLVLKLGEM